MMASYFDEHDCRPLGDDEQPNHLLHLARLLLDSGLAREWDLEFESIFNGERPAPPASKKAVEELPILTITATQEAQQMKCPVCLGEYSEGDHIHVLPCKHDFHPGCILPWLQKTNSCPLCRLELPTDDVDYEEFKRQKARKDQREFEQQSLHDAMFG